MKRKTAKTGPRRWLTVALPWLLCCGGVGSTTTEVPGEARSAPAPDEEEAALLEQIAEERWQQQERLRPIETEERSPGVEIGAALVTISGGELSAPITVPLWLTFDGGDTPDRCAQGNRAVVVQLEDGRIFIQQLNDLCSDEPVCQILDPRSGTYSTPTGGCLESEGTLQDAELIAPGWLLIRGNEGVFHVSLSRYSPEEGQQSGYHLRYGVERSAGMAVGSTTLRWERTDRGLRLTGSCQVLNPDICQGQCVSTWAPHTGLVLEEVPPSTFVRAVGQTVRVPLADLTPDGVHRDPTMSIGVDDRGTLFCRERLTFSFVANPDGCDPSLEGAAEAVYLSPRGGQTRRLVIPAPLSWVPCDGPRQDLSPTEAFRALTSKVTVLRRGFTHAKTPPVDVERSSVETCRDTRLAVEVDRSVQHRYLSGFHTFRPRQGSATIRVLAADNVIHTASVDALDQLFLDARCRGDYAVIVGGVRMARETDGTRCVRPNSVPQGSYGPRACQLEHSSFEQMFRMRVDLAAGAAEAVAF